MANTTTGIHPDVARMMGHIQRTYQMLAEPAQWVLLSEIANYIDAPAEIISQAYRLLYRCEGVHLIPESTQGNLTQEDWDAAVQIGAMWMHLISIQ